MANLPSLSKRRNSIIIETRANIEYFSSSRSLSLSFQGPKTMFLVDGATLSNGDMIAALRVTQAGECETHQSVFVAKDTW